MLIQLDCPCLMDVLMFCSWLQMISSGKLKTEHSLKKMMCFLTAEAVKIPKKSVKRLRVKWGVCDQRGHL